MCVQHARITCIVWSVHGRLKMCSFQWLSMIYTSMVITFWGYFKVNWPKFGLRYVILRQLNIFRSESYQGNLNSKYRKNSTGNVIELIGVFFGKSHLTDYTNRLTNVHSSVFLWLYIDAFWKQYTTMKFWYKLHCDVVYYCTLEWTSDHKLHSGVLFAKFTLMYINTKYISMNIAWSVNLLNVNFQKTQLSKVSHDFSVTLHNPVSHNVLCLNHILTASYRM